MSTATTRMVSGCGWFDRSLRGAERVLAVNQRRYVNERAREFETRSFRVRAEFAGYGRTPDVTATNRGRERRRGNRRKPLRAARYGDSGAAALSISKLLDA